MTLKITIENLPDDYFESLVERASHFGHNFGSEVNLDYNLMHNEAQEDCKGVVEMAGAIDAISQFRKMDEEGQAKFQKAAVMYALQQMIGGN